MSPKPEGLSKLKHPESQVIGGDPVAWRPENHLEGDI
jgi:hypothetical protein